MRNNMATTYQAVSAVQRKNWDPLVLGPAFAMDRIPGPVCLSCVAGTREDGELRRSNSSYSTKQLL